MKSLTYNTYPTLNEQNILHSLICNILYTESHHQNKCFALKFKFWRNASKFPIFIEKENPSSFFRFSFRATFIFPFMNTLVYANIDQDIHMVKLKLLELKNEKNTCVFFLYKYSKFWSISLKFKLEHKLFILEVWMLKEI